jgi:hypothetical protein
MLARAMVFADTPYNTSVRAIVGRGKIKHREFAAASGEMGPFKEFTGRPKTLLFGRRPTPAKEAFIVRNTS